MSLCKEKVKKMMNFRKVCSLSIVNRQSACQPQMFKGEQGYLSQCTNQILLGKLTFHTPLGP